MALDMKDVYRPQSLNKLLNSPVLNNSQQNKEPRVSTLVFDPSAQKNQSAKSLDEAAKLSLSAFDSTRTGFLTESEMINGINAALKTAGIQAPKPNSDDFSPKAVAGRILDRVSSIIEQFAGSPEQANEMLQKARKGIAKGLDQARDTLKALGALNDTTKNTVKETENLINKGLETLEKSLAQLFDKTGPLEKQQQPQPKGEEQVFQTQIVQVATSLAQTQAGVKKP